MIHILSKNFAVLLELPRMTLYVLVSMINTLMVRKTEAV
ncbi:hypothetical protein CAAU_0911 [Caloramator australicus RC3]|uniref:Uncharacterized protein n=1 Tax=Caloramator australicus RC3 TaxID=857293 RepID=I7LG48_9CLOT|nr:hypothetical protein CAAU_0911 [Caloramator australicus RC3]